MSISRPVCTISLVGKSYTNSEAALRAIDIDMSIDWGHDLTLINCSNLSPLREAKVNDSCIISIGYEGEEKDVFKGIVTKVTHNFSDVWLEVMAATYPLSHTYTAQAYEGQTVADIISDLAGKAQVETGAIDANLPVAIWHVTEQRSAWWNINNLAKLGDSEVLCNESGALIVRPVGSGESHFLRYGAELLSLNSTELYNQPSQDFAPAGAGSELGKDKWHISLKEPVGEAPEKPAAILGAIRDKDAAQQVTESRSQAVKRSSIYGKAFITGNNAIRPGDLIDFEDVPGQEGLSARVTRVKHLFDAERGFLTTLCLGGTR